MELTKDDTRFKLFYYTWSKDEKHNDEIDFLLSRGVKIGPIEVKSSGYKTHASLDDFCSKFSSRIGNRYLVYTKDLNKDGQTVLVPVYMTPFLLIMQHNLFAETIEKSS